MEDLEQTDGQCAQKGCAKEPDDEVESEGHAAGRPQRTRRQVEKYLAGFMNMSVA
jgi:hypothetical protein